MHLGSRHLSTLAIASLLLWLCHPLVAEEVAPPDIANGFETPPDSAKPLVWWHWINGNVTKEGIEADLADMKRAGLAGAQMLDVSIYLPPGPVRYGTDLWHEHVQHAIKTADELGLEFMMMNSPGWSASGGPWVDPERSMKKLVWSECEVDGDRHLDLQLPLPITRLGVYHDVALFAVPADAPETNILRSPLLKAAKSNDSSELSAAFDGDPATSAGFAPTAGESRATIDFAFTEPVDLSQLEVLLTGLAGRVAIRGTVEIGKDNDAPQQVASFNFPDHQGADVQFQVPFKPVSATTVRLTVRVTGDAKQERSAIAEISLGHPPRLSDWPTKIKMAERSLERLPADTVAQDEAIPLDQVHDLTKQLDEDGGLECELPPGRWTLLRFGYTSTGSMNHPAVPEGHGLEIDKLDGDAVAFYFDRALGRILDEAGPRVGKTFTGILFDSFEGGPQNWTASFSEQFSQLKGYELTPYLPIVTGRILESPALADAFLYDFRTAVEELIARNYFGTMQRLAHKHGLSIYAEAQGGPLNPVSSNEYVDVPMNEFWVPDTTPRAPRIKLVSSTANLLGRRVVAAEAFTSTPENDSWRNSPATLKRSGDYAFTAGINRYIFHYYAHQPVTEAAPGFTLGRYGTHFGRLNTWWPYATEWLNYVARCQFLLQQGHTVADVCFLLNEDFGYGFPASMIDAPAGYDFDICYPRHVPKMEFEDGAIVLPNNRRYRLIVVPRRAWATDIATLNTLHKLVVAGACVLGEPPVAPAGLSDHLHRAAEFDTLVTSLWGKVDGEHVRTAQVGKGTVLRGVSVAEALQQLTVTPDVAWSPRDDDGEFRFIHRRLEEEEMDAYFVFNHSSREARTTMEFRSSGRTPELWNPVTGTRVAAPLFDTVGRATSVPLVLEPYGSMFVVFRNQLPDRWATAVQAVGTPDPPAGASLTPQVEMQVEMFDGQLLAEGNVRLSYSDGTKQKLDLAKSTQMTIPGPWQVTFQPGRGAPAAIEMEELTSWAAHPDPGVKYFSGAAEYRTQFTPDFDADHAESAVLLDLGRVCNIAEVCLNGEQVGLAWHPPFRLDVTRMVRDGRNELVVVVANQWVNRMIGDERIAVPYGYKRDSGKFTTGALLELPDWLYDPAKRVERQRISFSTWKHFTADSPLLESGLLGPVTLEQKSRLNPQPAAREPAAGGPPRQVTPSPTGPAISNTSRSGPFPMAAEASGNSQSSCSGEATAELWDHLASASQRFDVRRMAAHFNDTSGRRVLKLEVPGPGAASQGAARKPVGKIAWVAIPPPRDGWNLERVGKLEANVKNVGPTPAEATLWVISSRGWAAVGASAQLDLNQATTLSCDLRDTYPDGTPKIDPGRIEEIRIMIQGADSASVEVTGLLATGTADEWVRPAGRIDVPDMMEGEPAPGRRVRYQLPADASNRIYHALYLPPDWSPDKRYPVIVEFPGNIFFKANACWSTGRPEQCVLGYGISMGTNAIWISLPFVDRANGEIAESGFGSNDGDDTTAYTLDVVDHVCANWGGDRSNLFLCGFSRGAIACGYIGLRNDNIARLWKGFVACQHYDGSNWHQSRMEDAIQRAPRFCGKAIFQVDNSDAAANYKQLMDHTDPAVKWTWTDSGLGYHATAMFLDDRPMAKQVRKWFLDLTAQAETVSARRDFKR